MPRDLSVTTLHPRNVRTGVTPAFNRVPKWEMRCWQGFFYFSIISVPLWVIYHLPDYRNGHNPHKLYIWMNKYPAKPAEDEE